MGGLYRKTCRTYYLNSALPLKVREIDVCMVFMALYIFGIKKYWPPICKEIVRVLKPGGRLAILECKKEEMPFGPPFDIRLTPEEVAEGMRIAGFEETGYTELAYTYLIQFKHTAKFK